jgi:hypothetical protein
MARACRAPGTRTREATDHEYAAVAHLILNAIEKQYNLADATNDVDHFIKCRTPRVFYSEQRLTASVHFLSRAFNAERRVWVEIPTWSRGPSFPMRSKYTRGVLDQAALWEPDAFKD